MRNPKDDDIKRFWEQNPLFVGETSFVPGSREFFQEHSRVVIEDCFAGKMEERIFPIAAMKKDVQVLDAGCGIGFWLEQFGERGFSNCTGIDVSSSALKLARQRMEYLNLPYHCREGNIESLPFDDATFDHVNCQGVIHHISQPEAALSEIWRVLKPSGTANVSVYYENFLLRNFDFFKPIIRGLALFGFGLHGRGRETLLLARSRDELVRQFDGLDNPHGICFSRSAFEALIGERFQIQDVYTHFFPRRAGIRIPDFLHRFLDKKLGFMIFASLVKKEPKK